jgi:transcriptional regulator with XRE-family HTH domain
MQARVCFTEFMSPVNVSTIGSYIREQREQAKISLRQLAQAAGVSNPYLSQIERGLRRPSADILQQIAKGLRISAEALYVQAGLLEDRPPGSAVRDAVLTDPELTERQKQMLIEIYESFRKEAATRVLSAELADDEATELDITEAALAWPEELEPAALARWALAADPELAADSAVLAIAAEPDERDQEPGFPAAAEHGLPAAEQGLPAAEQGLPAAEPFLPAAEQGPPAAEPRPAEPGPAAGQSNLSHALPTPGNVTP